MQNFPSFSSPFLLAQSIYPYISFMFCVVKDVLILMLKSKVYFKIIHNTHFTSVVMQVLKNKVNALMPRTLLSR
jgi:hypothetical protein